MQPGKAITPTIVTECLFAFAYSLEPRCVSVAEGEGKPETHEFWGDLESIARVRVYKSGALLFEQGAEPAGVYLIRFGCVRIFASSRLRHRSLAEAGPGTILGLSECFSAEKHKVSAKALSRVEASFIDRRRLMMYLREHHKTCMQVVHSLSQVVHSLSQDLRALYHAFRLARSHRGTRKSKIDGGNPGPKGE